MRNNIRSFRIAMASVVALSIVYCDTSSADAPRRRAPRLVVLVVVDQLRADYLTRFEVHFGDGGFRRLMDDGACFANAHFNVLNTATAPGHSTIATGATPRVHGVVANKWFMNTGTTQAVYAVADDACEAMPAENRPGRGRSPHRLQVPTLGDQLKLADRRSRVVAVALKDRSAIFLGGRMADRSLWWNFDTGRFVTSTFYDEALPEYVEAFNAAEPTRKYANYEWRPLAPASAREGAYPVQSEWHPLIEQLGTTFPHKLPPRDESALYAFHGALWATPAGNDLVLDIVERALSEEQLGRDDVPDLLCVGFSSNDAVGHFFGPQSAEVMDMTLHTDRQIGRLFAMLDEKVGRDRYVMALSADHGVNASPPVLESLKLGGGSFDARQLGVTLNKHLQAEFFAPEKNDESERLIVVGVEIPWIYLNMPLVESLPPDRQTGLYRSAIRFLKARAPIADAYGPETLQNAAPPETDAFRLLAWNAYNEANAGQICVRIAPNWKKADSNLAGHNGGSLHERHVPILLCGPGVQAGRYFTPATPCDIAPTLAALLGIEPPVGSQGRVLHEGLTSR